MTFKPIEFWRTTGEKIVRQCRFLRGSFDVLVEAGFSRPRRAGNQTRIQWQGDTTMQNGDQNLEAGVPTSRDRLGETAEVFGKRLSEYVAFQKVILALVALVGITRLGLSLAGVPDGTAKWFSMTV